MRLWDRPPCCMRHVQVWLIRSEPKPSSGCFMKGRRSLPPPSSSSWSKPLPPDATQSLELCIARFAKRLLRLHPDEITRDPRKFKRRAVAILRRKLPPFAGRPAEESITRAAALRAQAREWREIYPICILNHTSLTAADRRQAESNLRAALRSRRNAAKRRNARAGAQMFRLNPR